MSTSKQKILTCSKNAFRKTFFNFHHHDFLGNFLHFQMSYKIFEGIYEHHQFHESTLQRFREHCTAYMLIICYKQNSFEMFENETMKPGQKFEPLVNCPNVQKTPSRIFLLSCILHCVTLDHIITFQISKNIFFNSSSISDRIFIFRILATSMTFNLSI